MTPRPLHRWKSFWLGIFVLASIAWAWSASIDRLLGAALRTPAAWIGLAQFDGEAGLFVDSARKGSWDYQLADQPSSSYSSNHEEWRTFASTNGIIILTHAQLIILFLLTWSAFLYWRHRRAKPLTDQSPPPEPTP